VTSETRVLSVVPEGHSGLVTRRPTASWLPAYLALAAIWGCSFLFIKVAVEQIGPFYVALGRVGVGALTLLLALPLLRQGLPRDPRLWLHLFVIAALMNSAPFTLFAFGEQRISSVLAGIWNATTPLTTLGVLLTVFPQERFTAQRIAGLVVGFLGVLTVLGVWHGTGGAALTGQLMCFGAALCYGFGLPYTRRFAAGRPESGASIAAGQLVMATVQLAVLAPLVGGAPPAIGHLHARVVASVLALGALGTGLAFLLNYGLIRSLGAGTMSTVTYVVPVFATAAGVLVLGEHLTWYEPVGALVILAGVAVSQGLLRLPRAVRPSRRAPSPSPAAAPQTRY
jgi:drug/metabolite transporter (DMT)-like permease